MTEASLPSTASERGWGWDFIDLAALGRNSPRSYIVSLLRIVLYHLALLPVVIAWVILTRRSLPPLALVVFAFGSVIAAGIAVLRSTVRTHRRPWRSLISTQLTIDWRRLAIGAAVQAALSLGFLGLLHIATGAPWPLVTVATWPVVGAALILTPLQAASEEVLVRGYLTQALGRVLRSRTLIVLAASALFAVLHLNAYGPLTLPYMVAVAVTLSLVSLRDGRLELAIGAHTAENWLGIGALDSLIYGYPQIRITWWYVVLVAVQGALFYGLTRLFVRRLDRRSMAPGRKLSDADPCEAGVAEPSPKGTTWDDGLPQGDHRTPRLAAGSTAG